MYDALLNLVPLSITPISAAGTTKGNGMYLGRNRTYRAIGRAAGDWTVGATCVIGLEESTTQGAGGSWTAIVGAPSLTITEQVGGFATTPSARPSPEIPSTVTALPSVTFTPTKDYVRASIVVGGTTPTVAGMSVTVEPVDMPVLASGR